MRALNVAAPWGLDAIHVAEKPDPKPGAGEVLVTVRNASGEPVLSRVVADGPVTVARLDPGRYEVEATLAGQCAVVHLERRAARARALAGEGDDAAAPAGRAEQARSVRRLLEQAGGDRGGHQKAIAGERATR